MKINMISSMDGSINGINVSRFNKGEAYDVPDFLGETFIKIGCALKIECEDEQKDAGAAPFNKAVTTKGKKKDDN